MRKYENLGFCPKNVKCARNGAVRGICHDENNWYVVQGNSIERIAINGLDVEPSSLPYRRQVKCKIYRSGMLVEVAGFKGFESESTDSPSSIALDSTLCIGDIDYYNGFLFVPISRNKRWDSQILVFSAKDLDCVGQFILYKKNGEQFQKLNWCAVNPLDGCLYTSDAYVSDSSQGPCSPVMAFKINLINGCVSCFGACNQIRLERNVYVNSDEKIPYILDAEIRGGCFDSFDTLYLSSNSSQEDYVRNKAYYLWLEKGCPIQSADASKKDWFDANSQIDKAAGYGNPEHAGITAFVLKRKNTSSDEDCVREKAYALWVAKGRPFQSDEFREKDWMNAIAELNASVLSEGDKSVGAAYAAVACVKSGVSKYTDDSIIDFSFDESGLEEPAGITYWDLRCYAKDDEMSNSCYDGCLHALKVKKDPSSSYASMFSLQNFLLRNLETTSIIRNYDPKKLYLMDNGYSGPWRIYCGSVLIKEFSTSNAAHEALAVMKNFKSIILVGHCNSSNWQYNLSYDFLYNRVSNPTEIKNANCKKIHFDSFYVDNMRNVVENKWKGDYEVVFELNNYELLNETYQRIGLPMHNISVGSVIENIIINHSSYSKEKGGYLNYLMSSSNRPKDNLYWFD